MSLEENKNFHVAYPTAPAGNDPPTYDQTVPQDEALNPAAQLDVQTTFVPQPVSRVMLCPHCNVSARTVLKKEIGLKNHMFAATLCVSIMCIPCMWIPYKMDQLKDANHYCSACGGLIGQELQYLPFSTRSRRRDTFD